MKIRELTEWGRIVKGVNTTADVDTNSISREAGKFGNKVDKDGRPPTLSKKVKGSKTNVLFNLGLSESVKMKFQRGEDFDTLHIKPKNKNRVELRGKPGYERGNYDAQDKLHQVLDRLGKAANFAELMNGEVVTINPKHPDGERAKNTVQDVLSTEGWSKKYKDSINCSNPKGFSQKAHCAGRKKNEGAEITMWTNPEYQGADVDDKYYEKQPVKIVDVSELTPFEPADKMDPKDNHDNMMKFVDKIKAGKKIKPIVIVPHDDKLLIVDGHHRYFAHLKAGEDKIRAVIADPKDLTWRDDVPESIKESQELASTSTIYVDMDGVLADFFGDWAKLMGKDHWTKIDDISPALQKIRDTEDFWLNLPLTDNAKNLLMLIKDVKGEYNILSSPLPDDPNSEPHKREWIKKNLNFFLPKDVIITHDKARYATTEDGTPNILIDDYGQNIQKWESAGGVGFKHKDHKFERTAQNIKQHMQEPVESLSQESLTPIAKPITLEIFKEKADLYIKGLIGGFPKEEMKQKLNTLLRKAINQGTVSQQEGSNYIKNRIAEYLDFVKKNPGQPLPERELTKDEEKEKERIVKGMKKNKSDFKDRYGDDAEAVMYATATKMAKEALRSGRYTPDQILEILENFADGKVSGKSRPGRVKRAGASCSGSVTELRAKARNASGERAKMYHWCANMKSGRNK
jgi:5'(3')-deoxyribonucleotidase